MHLLPMSHAEPDNTDCVLPQITTAASQSAALGLAIAGALALGYANIFVTAPSPENLRTLFEFVFKASIRASHAFAQP